MGPNFKIPGEKPKWSSLNHRYMPELVSQGQRVELCLGDISTEGCCMVAGWTGKPPQDI